MRDERFPYCSVAILTARVNSTSRPCQQVDNRATTKPRIYWRKRAYCRGLPKWPGVCDSGGERRGSDAAVSKKTTSTSIAGRGDVGGNACHVLVAVTTLRCALVVCSSEAELRRDEKRVSSRVTRNAMTLAMSALLFGAVNASAQSDIVLQASNPSARAGRWAVVSDSGAAGGAKIRHADAGAAKIDTAAASPANYFELTFSATRGVPYRLWVHGRADGDDAYNDSVFVQFAGSVNSSGGAVYRIGTTAATEVNLEPCKGCGLSGWMWQDNGWGYGVLGPVIYFATTGTQRMRVQTREDGMSIDRILLSPSQYLNSKPPEISQTSAASDSVTAASTSGQLLKLMDWNIHHGVGTDGSYNISRIADWIVKTGANVVSLNEVEKYTGWGNEDQPARFAVAAEDRRPGRPGTTTSRNGTVTPTARGT